MNPLKSIFDVICVCSKSIGWLYPFMPVLYSIVTIIFIILGIVGIIAFSTGNKFKNTARTIYGVIHLVSTFFNMLILFNITYCSLAISTTHKTEDSPSNDGNGNGNGIDKSIVDATSSQAGGAFGFKGIGTSTYNMGATAVSTMKDFFKTINSIVDNNNIPVIIIHVLCSSLVVIVFTYMSSIFGGIAKAGYQIHCTESKEAFSSLWWGNLVDFFMYLLLIGTSIFTVIYFFAKPMYDAFKRLIPKKQASGISSKVETVMNNWPLMRAAFIISLSYYIIRLVLQGIEDIISNNIVLLTSWKTRETECSDEPNKQSKIDIERGVVLFGNILFFIILVILTIALVVINFTMLPAIRQVLGTGIETYTTSAAALLAPLSFDGVKRVISNVGKGLPGGINSNAILKTFETQIATLATGSEKLDVSSLAEKLDVSSLAEKLDVSSLSEKLDAGSLAKNLDAGSLAKNLDAGSLAGNITGESAPTTKSAPTTESAPTTKSALTA